MESTSDVEVEPYEEMISHLDCRTPFNSRSTSPVNVAATSTAQSAFYGPIEIVGKVGNEGFPSTELFAPVPRSALRHELAAGRDERTAVVTDRGGSATLAPNVGLRLSGQNLDSGRPFATADRDSRRMSATLIPEGRDRTTKMPDESDALDRPLSEPLTVHRNSAACDRERDRPQSAPISWMAAITARVNSLWNSFYNRSTLLMPALNVADGECVEKIQPSPAGFSSLKNTGSSFVRQEASVFPVVTDCQERRETQSPNRRIWHLDSDTEIVLDGPHERRISPELDLRVPQRSSSHRAARMQGNSNTHDETPRCTFRIENEQERRPVADQRRIPRPEKKHKVSRTDDQSVGRREQLSRRSEERSVSSHRHTRRSDDRSSKRRDSSQLTCGNSNEHRNEASRVRRGDSSPSSDHNDSDKDTSDDNRRRRSRRPGRSRRRGNPSPDDGDGSDDGDSSDEDNAVGTSATGSRHFRIKLQKFDGTGSWESWWAHFENCASYNRWTDRDQLAFMKGALTGNAAQVLWDTDRASTGSLKKLVSILKNRFSGERQAEKYRAELQLRRRKSQESLTELHQDIRRLMALAYPRLTAEAREEIACDHFTNALSDPDFALKVKERAPKSLDEALNIALRLEAWAKSISRPRQDDDRPDRPRQKVRATAQTENSKACSNPEATDRITGMEAKMTQMSEQLKRLSGAVFFSNRLLQNRFLLLILWCKSQRQRRLLRQGKDPAIFLCRGPTINDQLRRMDLPFLVNRINTR